MGFHLHILLVFIGGAQRGRGQLVQEEQVPSPAGPRGSSEHSYPRGSCWDLATWVMESESEGSVQVMLPSCVALGKCLTSLSF